MSKDTTEAAPDKIRFLYNVPEDYKPIYVNGAYGGMTPRGELLAHFFFEYHDIPAEEIVPLKEGKLQIDEITKISKIKHPPTERIVKREVRVGLVIPAHQVHSIANWMIDKLKSSGIVVEEIKGEKV